MVAPVILVEAAPRDVATGAATTVRLAGGGANLPYYYDAQHWRAGVVQLPAFVAQLQFDGTDLGTGGVPQAAEIQWAPARRADLDAVAGYFWFGATITIRIGPEGALPPVRLTGKVFESEVADGVLKLRLTDPAADLKKPLLSARYGGTGGLDGPADWDGKIKRRVWGRIWNLAGEPIDAANNIYAFADPAQKLQSIDAVRDMGAPAAALTTVAWAGSMAATLTALRAAAAPAGGGVVCPSIACVKWWTKPAGELTADLKGEIGAGYVETTADIAARVVGVLGTVTFAAGTVAAAAALRPAPVGWLATDDTTTVAAMLEDLLGSASLLWLLSSTGQIVIRPWAWGASTRAGRSSSVKRTRVFAPVATRKIGYQRNETKMARGDLAAIVLAGSLSAYLTNESATLQANAAGTVTNFAPAAGRFVVLSTDGDGNVAEASGVTFSVVSAAGITAAINAAGNYTVSALSADTGTATLRAEYASRTFDKVLTVSKARAGSDGSSSAVVSLYRRTTTSAAPAVATTGSATYTFATGGVTGQPAGWTIAAPDASAGGYLWSIQATAAGSGATDAIANTEWSAPALIVQNGADGADGSKNAIAFVYQRAASVPAVPSVSTTYTFATGVVSGLNNGWSNTIPAGSNPLYVTVATATGIGATDTIAAAEWAAPVVLVQDGAAGLNVATVNLFQRTTTNAAPGVVTTGNTTYTFATGGATGRPSGWTVAVPDESAGKYLWTIQATAAATTATDVIANTEWSAPALVAKSGDNGSDGTDGDDAISGYLTNEVLSVFAYADGTVVSYTGATGDFRVFSGATDISSSFALSTLANPQAITIAYTGRTYTISGGMGASENVASVTIRATGSGAYAGVTIDKVVSISKTKGGYEIVTSLPTTNLFVGRVVFLTTDGKLYRYIATGWTSAVPAVDISGTLTSAQISALDAVKLTGTLGADLFAANTIAAGKILAMDTNNMVADPQFTDIGASTGTNYWGLSDWTIIDSGSHLTALSIPRGVRTPDGSTLSVAPPAVVSQMGPAATRISVEAGKPYRIYARAQLSTGFTGWARIGVRWYDKDGVECATGSPSRISAIGGSDYRVTATTGGVTCIFDGVVTAPADAVYGRFLNYVTWSDTTTKPGLTANAGFATYGAPRMMRAMNAELVVDGEIRTAALAAEAVTTDKIKVGAVTAATLDTTNAVITGTAQIKDLTVDTIHIKNGAVTNSVSAYTAGVVAVVSPTVWSTLQSATITAANNDVIDVVSNFMAQFVSGSSTAINLRIRRGSTVLFSSSAWTPQYLSPAFSDIPGAGTFTYYLEVLTLSTPAQIDCSSRYLRLLRTRK